MADIWVTGNTGLALIKGRVLDATYVMCGEYQTPEKGLPAKPGGRIATTYKAMKDGPRTGQALYAAGNWMPTKDKPMSESDFKAHLQWMVRKSRLHVVRRKR